MGFLNNTCFFLASEKKVAVHLSMWKSSDNHFKPIAASKGEETLRDAELVSFAKKNNQWLERKESKTEYPFGRKDYQVRDTWDHELKMCLQTIHTRSQS